MDEQHQDERAAERRARARARARQRMARKRKRGAVLDHRASESEPSLDESSSERSNEDLPARARRRVESSESSESNEQNAPSDQDEQCEGIGVDESDQSDDQGDMAGAADVAEDSEQAQSHSSGDENEAGSDSDHEYEYPPNSEDSESDEDAEESEDDTAQESEGSDADTSDEEPDNDDAEHPIYPGAPISLRESLVAIFSLMSVEHLSGTLVGRILSLIALHCPPGSIVKKTLYKFKKFFANFGSAFIVFHYFCSDCMYPVNSKGRPCTRCKKGGDNISYFLEVPLVYQLQHLLSRANFYQDLQFRFRADRKRHTDNIEDIYDGRIYEEEMENGFLSNPANLSFMWNSDGVKVFNSASFSIWPLFLVINELPYKKRTLPENILLFGLWFGKSKPNPNIFLRPLKATMKKLESDGHDFTLPDNSKIRVRCKIICGTCDMPAKCKFLQMKQYNGEYGCPRCLQPGGRMAAGKSTVQVYPYTAGVPKRTHAQTLEQAREALEARKTDKKSSVCGVKGPSLVSKLVPDLIRCTAIDAMHGVFLGVCKLLLGLWFDSKHSGRPWSLHHLMNVVGEKLNNIKPPSYAVRAPRSLSELKFWKASEYKLFFIYYSIPVLKGLMEEAYMHHHCKLVSAVTLLNQDSISIAQIQAASSLLVSYVSDFSRLYSLRYLGINVHQLLHLPDVVLDLGPLFVYSTFFLESLNGVINKFFHGTQHVALQICCATSMLLQMPNMRKALLPDSEVLKFCVSLETGKPFKVADVVGEEIYAGGKYNRNPQQVLHSKQVLLISKGIASGQFDIFYRIKKNGVIYYSKDYSYISVRNESSFVCFLQDDSVQLGRILRFVKWSNCNYMCELGCGDCPSSFYAIIEVYRRCFWFVHEYEDIRLSYIWRVERTENIVAVTVQSLCSVCFYFPVDNDIYMACPVNRLEIE